MTKTNMHHMGAIATTIITVAVMVLSNAQHDIPLISTWLETTAIPNAMIILGILKELEVGGIGKITVQNVSDVSSAIKNIRDGFTLLEQQLKNSGAI